MKIFTILFIVIVLAIQLRVLYNSYRSGLHFSLILFIVMSEYIMIEIPGAFPDFTIQRLVLLVLAFIWLVHPEIDVRIETVPFLFFIILFAASNLLSMAFSKDIAFSIKQFLSFTMEIMLFYIIIITSMKTRQHGIQAMKAIWLALFILAGLGVVEHYTGFNPIDTFLPGYTRAPQIRNDVMVTLPHRILLGSAMAMGWPLAIGLMSQYKNDYVMQSVLWISVACFLSVCYFADSRGPWIASLVVGLVLFSLGSNDIRKKLLLIAGLSVLVVLMRPGVFDSIQWKVATITDSSTFKGSTYEYRWELWRKAYTEISHSPLRMLFGFGPGTSETLSWEGMLSYSGRMNPFDSWDNHYAAYLLETGFVGLTSLFVFYFAIFFTMVSGIFKASARHRDMLAGVIASIVVILFMKTNVKIFAAQLDYLFWALVAAGTVISHPVRRAAFVKKENHISLVRL